MNRQEIIERINKFEYDHKDFWVITGAAMVLYGIRSETNDIDLGCNKKMADELQKKYEPIISHSNKRIYHLNDEIEIYEDWLYDDIETIENIQVISISGLIKMKTELSREKDKRDLQLIEEYLKKEC